MRLLLMRDEGTRGCVNAWVVVRKSVVIVAMM